MSPIKERPILFGAPMVRAILEGRKTQTRRVVFPPPKHGVIRCHWSPSGWGFATEAGGCLCSKHGHGPRGSYGTPGDRLWVRETFMVTKGNGHRVRYKADAVEDDSGERRGWWFGDEFVAQGGPATGWRPSIHMPRWASRITLEVTDVRVERMNDISEEDAKAEGVDHACAFNEGLIARTSWPETGNAKWFRALWESIHGEGSWDSNPWVWVISFKRVEAKSEAA